jgi:hypothetical protein
VVQSAPALLQFSLNHHGTSHNIKDMGGGLIDDSSRGEFNGRLQRFLIYSSSSLTPGLSLVLVPMKVRTLVGYIKDIQRVGFFVDNLGLLMKDITMVVMFLIKTHKIMDTIVHIGNS